MATEEIKGLAVASTSEEKAFSLELTSNFIKVRKSPYFVDKTLILKQWIEYGVSNLYVTAPPRFGKSTIIDTMTRFFGATYEIVGGTLKEVPTDQTVDFKLFHNTLIKKEAFFEEHFKKYYVLYISLSPLSKVFDYQSFKGALFYIIRMVLIACEYTLEDENIKEKWGTWIKNFTKNDTYFMDHFDSESVFIGDDLLKFLHAAFKKPIILVVDDYDSILFAHIVNTDLQDSGRILTSLGTFLKKLVKDEGELKTSLEAQRGAESKLFRSFFTGCLNLGGMMTPLLSNVLHIDFFDDEKIAQFYGLTKQEVQGLLKGEKIMDDYQSVEDFYNGYSVINKPDLQLFNILSVIMYMRFRELKPYREDMCPSDSVLDRFSKAFSNLSIGIKICSCLHEKECTIKKLSGVKLTQLKKLEGKIEDCLVDENFQLHYNDVSLFLTFLMELGFFSVIKTVGKNNYVIRPTNMETTNTIETFLYGSRFFNSALKIDKKALENCEEAVLTLEATGNSMADLGDAIFMLFSKHPPIKEQDHMAVLYSLFRNISINNPGVLYVEGSIRLGDGSAMDILLYFPKMKILIILEGKYEKSGAYAVDQILRQNYLDILKNKNRKYSRFNIDHKILWGLSISRKGSINMNYLIDTVDVEGSFIYTRRAKDNKGTMTKREK